MLAIAGGVLAGAAPDSAASAFVFMAVVAAGVRVEMRGRVLIVALGALALAATVLAYDGSGIGVLAYTLGFIATRSRPRTAASRSMRAEQAELLLAQTQRSHEEQLRAARLEESTRIAREIHDVLAHTLAGLTIQLEATSALIEQGADRDTVLARVQRAHELAREGLARPGARSARCAASGAGIGGDRGARGRVPRERRAAVELTVDGDPGRLAGPTGQAVMRVVQEALTNVRKHAPAPTCRSPWTPAGVPATSRPARRGPTLGSGRAGSDRARWQRRRLRSPGDARARGSCSGARSTPAPPTAAGGSSCAYRRPAPVVPVEDVR